MSHDTVSAPAEQASAIPLPNYTQVPNVLLDKWMATLTGAEFKVLMYIVRHTFGYGKTTDDISLSQITSGIIKHDGERLDGGAGVGKGTAVEAVRNLERWGLIYRERNRDADRGDRPTTYHLNVAAPSRVRKANTGSPENEHAPVREPDTQKKRLHKETEGQEIRFESSTDLGIAYDLEGIEQMVQDFRREFHDKADLGPTRQRTINLFLKAGVGVERFVEAMYEARRKTKGNGTHKESPMAYWFAVLEDQLR